MVLMVRKVIFILSAAAVVLTGACKFTPPECVSDHQCPSGRQ